ncbi:hypothetical protein [Shewanella sp. SR44-3]|uniref:hypothetical protein n=1 Tax=Shewanella sp. SR44-3 TaxID=2760936 RepID=UPI0021760DFD|nr:hypothetical protein [Shewanella sp. SR44-3]
MEGQSHWHTPKPLYVSQRRLDKLALAAIALCISGFIAKAYAGENTFFDHKFSGVVDVRASYSDSIDSYAGAGLGKFRFDDGGQLSLAQLGLSHQMEWGDDWSSHIVANGYVDGVDNNLGLSEAYLSYKPLPWDNGLRFDARAGLMYPQISLENVATAWASPYSLSYSTMNAWLGEEVRHLGARFSLASLGKYRQSLHDVSLTAEFFGFNDTSGAMLAWHGWTLSSRQSLLQENLPISAIPAMEVGGMLAAQAKASDPFLELDSRIGVHLLGQWRWHGQGSVQAGYYDNHADTRVVKQGQYAWATRFSHLGAKWRLPLGIELITQAMAGDTLMMSPTGINVVDNHFHSGFVLLSKKINLHRLSLRFEDFSVTDKDLTPGDNNSEQGQALTVSYQYQLSRPWFVHFEYNRIDSERMARVYQGASLQFVEQQWQLASRYFF